MAKRLQDHIVYLAGPIQYCADLGINWRQQAEKELRAMGIGVLNPMDKACNFANEDRETQANLKTLLNTARAARLNGELDVVAECEEEIHSIMKAIWRADLRMVDLASALLVRIDPAVHTCGTHDEITRARTQCKPIIIFCDNKDRYDIPLWLYGGNYKMMFDSLEQSLAYIKKVHENDDVEHFKQWKFFNFDKIFGRT